LVVASIVGLVLLAWMLLALRWWMRRLVRESEDRLAGGLTRTTGVGPSAPGNATATGLTLCGPDRAEA
jgi:hypothetical protein